MNIIRGFNIFITIFLVLIIYATFVVKNYTEEALFMLIQTRKQNAEEKHQMTIAKAKYSIIFSYGNIKKLSSRLLLNKSMEIIDLSKLLNKEISTDKIANKIVKQANWKYKDPVGDMRKISLKE